MGDVGLRTGGRLALGGLGENDATLGLRLRFCHLHQHPLAQRRNLRQTTNWDTSDGDERNNSLRVPQVASRE